MATDMRNLDPTPNSSEHCKRHLESNCLTDHMVARMTKMGKVRFYRHRISQDGGHISKCPCFTWFYAVVEKSGNLALASGTMARLTKTPQESPRGNVRIQLHEWMTWHEMTLYDTIYIPLHSLTYRYRGQNIADNTLVHCEITDLHMSGNWGIIEPGEHRLLATFALRFYYTRGSQKQWNENEWHVTVAKVPQCNFSISFTSVARCLTA